MKSFLPKRNRFFTYFFITILLLMTNLTVAKAADTTPPTTPYNIKDNEHPSESQWYINNTSERFTWDAYDNSESFNNDGIAGFSYILNQSSSTIPDGIIDTTYYSANLSTTLSDGTWYFHINAKDDAGNWGGAGHSSIHIDKSNPSTPTNLKAIVVNEKTVSLSWGASYDAYSGVDYYRLQRSTDNVSFSTVVKTSETTTTYTDTLPAEGVYYYRVKAVDNAKDAHAIGTGDVDYGNVSLYTSAVSVSTNIAPAAPTANSSTHPNQNNWYANNDPVFSWTEPIDASGITGYSFVLDQSSSTNPDNVSDTANTYTSFADKSDGTWYFHVKAVDGVGNWGTVSHFKVNIDTAGPTAPTVSSSTHPNQTTWYINNDPTFSWSTPIDARGVSGYSYTFDQVSSTTPDTISDTTGSSASFANKTDGVWYFHVRAKDGLGNWGTTGHYTVKIDATGPVAPVTTSRTHSDQNSWYSNNDPVVDWTTPSDVSGILVYSATLGQEPNYIPLPNAGTTNNTASFFDVADGIWYFHVRAEDGAGNWGDTNHYKINIDTVAPTTPTNLTASAVKGSKNVTLSWSPSTDATSGVNSYKIYRSTDNINFSYVDSSTTASYTDTAPNEGVFYYKVAAIDKASNASAYSNMATATIDAAPAAPVVSSTTHPVQSSWYTNNDPAFSWTTPVDNSGIAGYSYIIDQSSATTPDTTSDTSANSVSFTDKADGTWYFHVRAQDKNGNWGIASHYTVKIDTTTPTAPSNLTGTGNQLTLNLSWSAASDVSSGVKEYSIYRSSDNVNFTYINKTASLSYADTVPAEGTYYYKLKATDNAGNTGPYSATATVIANTAPAAPTVSSSTHPVQSSWYANNDPAFSWTAPADFQGINSYSYVLDNNSGTNPDTVVDTTAVSTAYSNASDGVRYFHVRAQDKNGLWGATGHYKTNIDTTGPNAVTNLKTTANATAAGDFTVNINWNPTLDAGSGVKEYALEKSTDNVTFTQIAKGAVTGYDDTIPGESGTFYYRVKAIDNVNNQSSYSSVITKIGDTLVNSSFETDADNNGLADSWNPIALIAGDGRSADYAKDGTYSTKITGQAANKAVRQLTMAASGSKGSSILLTGWSKTVGTSSIGGNIGFIVFLTHPDGTKDRYLLPINKAAHDWAKSSLTITALNDFVSADVYIGLSDQAGAAYFDNFKLLKQQ